ncbi:unnamed protein product, partial [Nippostrongylus brasiliensis]|uniref:Expressed conserved protein n=1 Tax=Nippostrongylus brasiliensis TaxID=27835 RepID=A0A0N4XRT6_NIPBR
MPLTRHYDYNYNGAQNCTIGAASQFGGSLAQLEPPRYHDAYYTYRPSYDLNRSVYTTPSGCSMSYRMNMTIHDPENCSSNSSFYDTSIVQKKKKSRVRAALKELLGRTSRRDLFRIDSSRKDVYRSESPRKWHDSSNAV